LGRLTLLAALVPLLALASCAGTGEHVNCVVVRMHRAGGQSVEQIAEGLGVNPDAVAKCGTESSPQTPMNGEAGAGAADAPPDQARRPCASLTVQFSLTATGTQRAALMINDGAAHSPQKLVGKGQ
jgi:hypothetical protein